MSGSTIPLAAFQVSTDGRFWVSPEVLDPRQLAWDKILDREAPATVAVA